MIGLLVDRTTVEIVEGNDTAAVESLLSLQRIMFFFVTNRRRPFIFVFDGKDYYALFGLVLKRGHLDPARLKMIEEAIADEHCVLDGARNMEPGRQLQTTWIFENLTGVRKCITNKGERLISAIVRLFSGFWKWEWANSMRLSAAYADLARKRVRDGLGSGPLGYHPPHDKLVHPEKDKTTP